MHKYKYTNTQKTNILIGILGPVHIMVTNTQIELSQLKSGAVPASATHANAQIHNKDTQLNNTNSKVQIIRLESGDPCLRPRCIFTNTLICPRANTNRNDHTTGNLRNDITNWQLLASFFTTMVPGVTLSLWVVVEGVV